MKTYITLFLCILLAPFCKAQIYPTIKEVFDFEVGDEFHYVWTENGPPQGHKYRILSKILSANQDTLTYVREKTSYSSYLITEPISHLRFSFKTIIDTIHYTQLDSGIQYYYEVKQSDSIHRVFDTNYISPQFWNQRVFYYQLYTNPDFEPTISTVTHIKGFGRVKWEYFQVASSMVIGYQLNYAHKQGVDYGSPQTIYLHNSLSNPNPTQRFQYYPNPVTQLLYLDTPPENLQQVVLRTLTGKTYKIFRDKEWLHALDLSELPTGLYILELQAEDTTYVKLVKQ